MGPGDLEDDEEILSELGLGRRMGLERAARKSKPWAVSVVVHAVLLGLLAYFSTRGPTSTASRITERLANLVAPSVDRPLIAQARREALVKEARKQRDEGTLKLGDFLLTANAIDAEEEGTHFDLASARTLYRARVKALRTSLDANPPEVAVPEVFDDVTYTGTPGGRMGDTLFTHRGSCEPVSHLVAASLYDAGLRRGARLRFYGGALAGVTHLTPVITVQGADGRDEEIDLMTGAPSEPGGTAFPAGDLVEAYARVHAVGGRGGRSASTAPAPAAARSAATAGLVGDGLVPTTRTLTPGYPANGDMFAGSLPLFAERAISSAGSAKNGEEPPRSEPPPCSFYVPLAWLDLPSASILDSRTPIDVDLVRAPSPVELERLSTIILEAEAHPSDGDLAARLLDSACLAALYDHAGLAFSLAGQVDVSARAVSSARRARAKGATALDELAKVSDDERTRIARRLDELAFGRAWILLFLEGGEEAVLAIARDEQIHFGRTMAITAMLVAPKTRARAVLMADALPIKMQIDLMHELMHAHDNARPWAASYDLDLSATPFAADTAFARNYRVFRALAWRLWDAGRTPEETVAGLQKEAAEAGLDTASRRAIGLYYLKHVVRLYRGREGGGDVIDRASAALVKAGFPGVSELEGEDDILPSERAMMTTVPAH